MDSAALLDLLGNENRRRILRLLARKPCYVTEISEYLGVSPKAVIDHLRKMEEVGLVESRTDENRRKYFHIARNLRLEVSVSPYDFGAKSAYAASPNLDIKATRYLSVDVGLSEQSDLQGRQSELAGLAAELDRLQQLEHELSLAQRWAQGRITDTLDRLSELFDDGPDGRLYMEILAALAGTTRGTSEVSNRVDAPRDVVEEALFGLADRGVVERTDDGWTIAE
ncbi:MAG: ArsR family transcriptional regulator [Halobacteriales archaeon]